MSGRLEEAAPEVLARRIGVIAADKKGEDIALLDMRGLVSYTDCLVICTARNERQAKAIHDAVYAGLKAEGLLPSRVEGEGEARWILMDYLSAILHVFVSETRDYYRLDVLWGEAERLSPEDESAPARARE